MSYNDLNFRGYLNPSILDTSGSKGILPSLPSASSFLDTSETDVLSQIDPGLNLGGYADDGYGLGPGSGHALGLSFGSGDGSVPGLDAGSFTPSFADKFWGYRDPKTGMMYDGYAKTGLGAVQAGLGFYLGKGQLDQAKKALRENQRQFNTNYAAQKATINDQLRWQHKARTDRDPTYRGQLTQIA